MQRTRKGAVATAPLALALGLGLAVGMGPREAQAVSYDWCAPVVVRPDMRIQNPSTCTSIWTDAEIGSGAEVVLLGDFTDVAQPVVTAPGRLCYPSPSHAANKPYVTRLRSARAAAGNGKPLYLVHMSRFDLVPYSFAALAPFDDAMLLTTDRPWSQVTGFFTGDQSAACAAGGCSWSDSWGGDATRNPPPYRLRDYIDRAGGAGRYQRVVQYLSRPDDPRIHWASSAIADLRNASYRAWRVAEAKAAIQVGGYDAIDLNHKLAQYRSAHWIDSPGIQDVASLNASGDTYWTAPPRGYGYSEYVQGWNQLARDLKAAGVPYEVTISWRAWGGNSYDDGATSIREDDLIREALRGAKVVLFDRTSDQALTPEYTQAVAQLAAYGPKIYGFDLACGYGKTPPGAPGRPAVVP